ncbi:MAG: carboxypeptidase-like regulatory domain-containing protein [Nocardioidaceae bacterium]
MTRDEIFDDLEQMWSERDPMPQGLVERMQVLAAAEVALSSTDLDYELMLLVERSTELAGARSAATAYTLRFGGDNLDLLVRAGGGNGDTSRLDGWVVPPAHISVRATRIDGPGEGQSFDTDVDDRGRFEFAQLPPGLYRLWLTPADPDAKPFATPAFEI